MALNESGLMDQDNECSDWIELFNSSDQPVNLSGWFLTDDSTFIQKWVFPDVSIAGKGYLVVFASDKDRNIATSELHTSFKLSGTGEYLALVRGDGSVAGEFKPGYPEQAANISYGLSESDYVYFSIATPGTVNGNSSTIFIAAPYFSHSHGFYEEDFLLSIFSETSGATIYYTTDGSSPSQLNGKVYSGPISIGTTTVVRAMSVVEGSGVSRVSTSTYLFTEDVIHQSNSPSGYPAEWGPYTGISGTAIADYEMDPELISNSSFAATVKDALKDLPTVSIVTDLNHLFSKSQDPLTGGIYIYTGPPLSNTTNGLGYGWERPTSVEYFSANDTSSFQVDCGIRLQGGHGRRPEKSPKHSFRLVFRDEYGPTKLQFPLFGEEGADEFNSVILRAGFGNTWHHWDVNQQKRATFQRDQWGKDTQGAMGHLYAHEDYVHLYINGIYWGMYSLSERMDSDFAASYLEGGEEDFDVIKDYLDVANGEITSWNRMTDQAQAGLSSTAAYQKIQGNNPDGTRNAAYEPLVDVVNFIDYMLINYYGRNNDWDSHNWAAVRNRVNPDKGFKFVCWDEENILLKGTSSKLGLNTDGYPTGIFNCFMANADFKRLLADRIQKHCFNGGVLTPENCLNRWMIRRSQIEDVVNCESARWGDYRRDVHPYSTKGNLYTKEEYWIPEQNYIINTYFPNRTSEFITELKNAGWFPSVNAPVFKVNGSVPSGFVVNRGDLLTMSTSSGTIYYTTDGSDPVVWSGSSGTISSSAKIYSSQITLSLSGHYKARTFYNGQWSALNDQFLIIPADYHDIKVTEIHYHPLEEGVIDGDKFEFLELKNTGNATLHLGGLSFVDGVTYKFPSDTELKPGGFIVIAADDEDFESRYGWPPLGNYKGQLDNGGEWILLITPANDTICHFRYNDKGGWPSAADGEGYSLVPLDINPSNDQTLETDWRASFAIGGSPGADDLMDSDNPNQMETDAGPVVWCQNYPNPFEEKTYIDFQIEVNAHVKLQVFDMMGRLLETLVDDEKTSGLHQICWDGSGHDAGVYVYHLTVRTQRNETMLTGKMIKLD